MSQSSVRSVGPADLVGAVFSLPAVSLVIAGLIVCAILIASRTARVSDPGAHRLGASITTLRERYAPEYRTLAITSIVVIIAFVTESVVRGRLLDVSHTVTWWRYALPLFCAALGLAALLSVIVFHGTTPPQIRVVSAARRNWMSFGPRTNIIVACGLLLALLATTIFSGLASSIDHGGQYTWLVIPIPNEAAVDPIRVPFYGWAFGVPVLLCLAALAIVTWAALHYNAARAYLRPDLVTGERAARREIAAGAVHIASAGILLALAGAWRFIARAGTGSQLIIEGQNDGAPYEVRWQFAELAAIGGWLAPVLEIVAFVLLLLVVAQIRRPRVHHTFEDLKTTATAGSAL